jgi:aldehyde:ferredoxin oxidoreductase
MVSEKTGGWAGKFLRVDLDTGKIWTESSIEHGQKYIGARGIASFSVPVR